MIGVMPPLRSEVRDPKPVPAWTDGDDVRLAAVYTLTVRTRATRWHHLTSGRHKHEPGLTAGHVREGEGVKRGVAGTPFALSTNHVGFDDYDYSDAREGLSSLDARGWSTVGNNAPVVRLRWTERELVALAAG
jgi:hypothetical protein